MASIATPRTHTPADAVAAQRQLTTRDMQLLSLLSAHHILTTTQIANILFVSENVARKRLAKLAARGILTRFRTCPGTGSVPWRYTLGPIGAMITAADNGHRTLPAASKTHERMLRISRSQKLGHLLGVNEFFSRLALHARNNSGCELRQWRSERQATKSYAGIVHPDGYGEWQENGRRIEFFLEFDNGTENMDEVIHKLEGYRDLSRAGENIPILFVFTGPRRNNNFHTRLTAQPGVSAGLVVASAALPELEDSSPAGPVWQPVRELTYRRLIDLSTPPAARAA